MDTLDTVRRMRKRRDDEKEKGKEEDERDVQRRGSVR